MVTFVSANRSFVCRGDAKKYASVNGPSRPMNINSTIISSPAEDKFPVSPRDNPTVPNADTASNTISNSGAFSVSSKTKIANQVTTAEIMVNANALLMLSLDISLLNT